MISKEIQVLLDDIKPLAERFIEDFSDAVLRDGFYVFNNDIAVILRDHIFIWRNGNIYSYVNTDYCINISIVKVSETNIVISLNTLMCFVNFSENKVIDVVYDSIKNLQAIKELLEKTNECKDWRYYVDYN